METVAINYSSARVRRTTFQGRQYLVAPMSLIVPGVLNGSKGPLYYPPDEVAKDPAIWNGVPIVVHHPTKDGSAVSARDPEVLENQGVGFVSRAKFTGKKLIAEGWFDVDSLKRIDPKILDNLESGRPVELSTGLYTDNQPAENGARHNGRNYSYVARNYKADHLAVFSDAVGACSLNDGCGVLANKDGQPTDNEWSAKARAAAIAARRKRGGTRRMPSKTQSAQDRREQDKTLAPTLRGTKGFRAKQQKSIDKLRKTDKEFAAIKSPADLAAWRKKKAAAVVADARKKSESIRSKSDGGTYSLAKPKEGLKSRRDAATAKPAPVAKSKSAPKSVAKPSTPVKSETIKEKIKRKASEAAASVKSRIKGKTEEVKSKVKAKAKGIAGRALSAVEKRVAGLRKRITGNSIKSVTMYS